MPRPLFTQLSRVFALLLIALSLIILPACKDKKADDAATKDEQRGESQQRVTRKWSASGTIVINELPADMGAFLKLREEAKNGAVDGAKVFLTAMLVTSNNPKLGEQMMAMASSSSVATAGKFNGSQTNLVRGLRDRPEIANSYIKGIQPPGKAQPSPPFVIEIKDEGMQAGDTRHRIMVKSAGASTGRPVYMTQENGYWLVHNFSSLASGVTLK